VVDPASRGLLTSSRRPIVLAAQPRLRSGGRTGPPQSRFWGVMLPYTPLHHLLLHDIGDMPLVMTAGISSDEPIAYEDSDALERLRGIADFS